MNEVGKHVVVVEYCAPCNYLGLAVELVHELLAKWGPLIESLQLVPSAWGTFEVTLDGELIFSKWALARHPKDGEVSDLVTARLGDALEGWEDHGPEKKDAMGFGVH